MHLRARLKDPSLLIEAAYIDGEQVKSTSGKAIDVIDPATGAVIASVPSLDAQETRQAIEAAERAWAPWRETPAAQRAAILERWHDLMIENLEDLAIIMTVEQGKPLVESRGEVRYGAGFVKWFSEEARRFYGSTIPAPDADRRIVVLKQPVGVSAAITPWNFPNAMITRKTAPAMAAGCPVVVKPSDLTPLSALALAVLGERAGIPKGVFNVVTGMPEGIGGELTSNPAVRKLSFTGSTRIGRLLMSQCAGTVKRVSFELGGNAPFIVFDDANLELAVKGVMASKFRNAGQTCVCANRILVQDGVHERFVDLLAKEIAKLKVGNGLEDEVTIGPLINQAAVDKVARHMDDALHKGAKLALGRTGGGKDLFVEPSLITGATMDMQLASEETFGPLAPIFRFGGEDEAIHIANGTPYGLAAYYFTENIRRSWRLAEQLEFGMVGLNTGVISVETAPFGGIKQSGLGREGSSFGIDEYLEIKTWHTGGLA